MKKRGLLLLAAIFAVVLGMFAFVACGGDEEPGLQLNKTEISIVEGKSGSIAATSDVANWSIDDEEIATLKPIGSKICTISAKKVGTATISATNGVETATCVLTVTEEETVTISVNDDVAETATVEELHALQLTATASLGSPITWQSSDEEIATVDETGLVYGVEPGTAIITAKVNSEVYAQTEVNVSVRPGSTFYRLKMATGIGSNTWVEEDNGFTGPKTEKDTYYYWASRSGWFQNLTDLRAKYRDGKISVRYKSDWNPGYWAGFKLMYQDSKLEANNAYKLTCKIDIKDVNLVDTEGNVTRPEKFKVTLNKNVIELSQGLNDVEVYFTMTESNYHTFDLAMGWEDRSDPNNKNGWFAQNATFDVYDVSCSTFEAIELGKPAFTVGADKVIHITTPSTPAEGVGSYLATFYKDDKSWGTVTVEDGKTIPTNTIIPGTYDVKIQAIRKIDLYKDSKYSDVGGTVTVVDDPQYDIVSYGEPSVNYAVNHPGVWTYFTSSWVGIDKAEYADGAVTFAFNNNKGNWYDTQLFYKEPGLTEGQLYKITMDINVEKTAAGGRITINGKTIKLQQGAHTYTVGYVERANSAAITVVFGVNGEDNLQEIQSDTIRISNINYEETTVEQLVAPATVSITGEGEDKAIEFADSINASSYDMAFFQDSATVYSYIFYSISSGDKLDLSTVYTGEYSVKIRAVGDHVLYSDSDWSTSYGTISVVNDAPITDVPYGENGYTWANGIDESNPDTWGPLGDVCHYPNKWYYWNDKNTNGSNVNVSTHAVIDDVVTLKYNCTTGTNPFGAQLFYDYKENTAGTSYHLTLKIKSDNDVTVKINGSSVQLKAGKTQEIVLDYNEPENIAYAGASVVIQIEVKAGDENTIYVSDVNCTENK